MGERLTLKPWAENEMKFGFELAPTFNAGIPTIVTPDSLGGGFDARFYWSNKEHQSHFINLEYFYQNVNGKHFTDPWAEGSEYDKNFHTFQLGFGKRSRPSLWYTEKDPEDPEKTGRRWGSFVTESSAHIGFTKVTVPGYSDSIAGESGSVNYPGGGSNAFRIGRSYGGGLEFRPSSSNNFQLTLMPSLDIGYIYSGNSGDSNQLNSMYIDFNINLYLGLGDAATDKNHKPTISDHILNGYLKLHGLSTRFVADANLNHDNELISDSGWNGDGSGGRNSDVTEQLRVLSSASAFAAGAGGSGTITSFMHSDDVRWLYLGLEAASGIASTAGAKSDATMSAGVGDFIRVPNMLVYTAFQIDTESGRNAKGSDIDNYFAYAFATRLALNTAIFFVGTAVGDNDAGHALVGGANNANISMAFKPAPGSERTAPTTVATWIPATYYMGDVNGIRGGALVEVNWQNPSWLYTQARLLSHGFAPENIGKRAANIAGESEPYVDTLVPSAVEATFGAQYAMKYFRIGGGLDFSHNFGGKAYAGFGLSARLEARIPITDEVAIILGGYGAIRKQVGDSGAEGEIAPFTGLELGEIIYGN